MIIKMLILLLHLNITLIGGSCCSSLFKKTVITTPPQVVDTRSVRGDSRTFAAILEQAKTEDKKISITVYHSRPSSSGLLRTYDHYKIEDIEDFRNRSLIKNEEIVVSRCDEIFLRVWI